MKQDIERETKKIAPLRRPMCRGRLNLLTSFLAFAAMLSLVARSAAQGETPHFDVTSVKPSNSTDLHTIYQLRRSGMFVAENASVRFLVRLAYEIQDFQIIGGPGWLDSDRFDIEARATQISDPAEMLPMLKSLLADRFKLTIHKETRQLPVFELVEDKGHSKLQVADPGACFARDAKTPKRTGSGEGQSLACGRLYFPAPNEILGKSVQMSSFAEALSSRVGKTVIDKTAAAGLFDIDLKWTPTSDASSTPAPASDSGAAPPNMNIVIPAILNALDETMGLKLRSGKGPVDVVVVDSVQKPLPN